ncbi:MAG: TetR/AcrR family transcriptional regulator [Neomegalonema sp.]|nr:TetR/AcrR family transcriptional regulator [Neomegalonema sp.]
MTDELQTDTTTNPIRQEIAQKAGELFCHYGYSKTNIGDIAQSCGMSAGNIYRYFKNKQAIGFAVVEDFMQQETEGMAQAMRAPHPSAEARLRAMIDHGVMNMVDHLRQTPKLLELADMVCDCDEGGSIISRHVEERLKLLTSVIRDGAQSGEFDVEDPEAASRAVHLSTKFFFIPNAVARHGIEKVQGDLDSVLHIVCRGLRACP